MVRLVLSALLLGVFGSAADELTPIHPAADDFVLVFQDEFNGPGLDWSVWDSEDGIKTSASGQRTYRSPANVSVEDGLLKLTVRKEQVKGADWTAAYVWLRENFGPNTYYEARFVNTKASGINNAFWFATNTAERKTYRDRYEIDCPENKLHEDGTIHAHLAWHDWKSYRQSDKQHVAQGIRVKLENTGFQTWGLWIGETEFAIYYEGDLQWRGTTHPKYHDQWCSGMGKLTRWTKEEEQRAYGKHGQDDWCYFGGMNGDVLNLCFSTIPWESKGTPLTDAADGAFMGVDYVRVYKPKAHRSWKPTQKLKAITPGKPIDLKNPVVLLEDGTDYFSFLVRPEANSKLVCMLRSGDQSIGKLTIESDGSMTLTSDIGVASTATSYPARSLNREAWQPGSEHLVVCRITASESVRDIISVATFPTSDPLPTLEPYLYPNIDEHGNTSITNQWDLSIKSSVDGTIDSIRFDFDPEAAACRNFQAGRGFTSAAAGNRRHAHRHIGRPIDIADVPADLVLPPMTDDEPAAGKRVRMQLPGWAQSEVYHSLYLPDDWTPGQTYPVIVELPGNGPFHNRFGDICSGSVDDAALGYGLSGGSGFIWIVVSPISEDRSQNQRYWWGDIDATVEYCIDAVRHTCQEFGGDPDRVVLTGFSRGSIGCYYVGLHNDEIAGLWHAFLLYSGVDGMREWNYPKSSRDDALKRLQRLGDRPTLVIADGSTAAQERYIKSTGTKAPFTYLTTGFRNHNDRWVLRDVPARSAAREWLADAVRPVVTRSAANVPSPTAHAFIDVAYGPHERNVFDFYRPTNGDGPFPLAVYIHGGGFRRGDKSILMRDSSGQLRRYLEAGIAVAAVNYRYSTQAPYPAPMHDAARAIQFIRHHATEFGVDPTRIAAWGGSAGGGISLWLAFHDDLADPDAADPIARQSTRLIAAAAVAAQTTYDPFVTNRIFPGIRADQTDMYRILFGLSPADESDASMDTLELRAAFTDASPDTHVSPDDPPVYLLYNETREVNVDTGAGIWVHHPLLGEHLVKILRRKGVPFIMKRKDAAPVSHWPYDDAVSPDSIPDFLIELLLGDGSPLNG